LAAVLVEFINRLHQSADVGHLLTGPTPQTSSTGAPLLCNAANPAFEPTPLHTFQPSKELRTSSNVGVSLLAIHTDTAELPVGLLNRLEERSLIIPPLISMQLLSSSCQKAAIASVALAD